MGRLELETKINRIGSKLVKAGKIVAGKTKDFVRGYTLKDETAVRRIISDPKTISPADIEKLGLPHGALVKWGFGGFSFFPLNLIPIPLTDYQTDWDTD